MKRVACSLSNLTLFNASANAGVCGAISTKGNAQSGVSPLTYSAGPCQPSPPPPAAALASPPALAAAPQAPPASGTSGNIGAIVGAAVLMCLGGPCV